MAPLFFGIKEKEAEKGEGTQDALRVPGAPCGSVF